MSQRSLSWRSWVGILSLAVIVGLGQRPSLGADNKFVKVVTADNQIIAGEIVGEDTATIEVLDYETGKNVVFKKATLKFLYRNVSEDRIAQSVGLPVYIGWKIKRHMPKPVNGRIVKIDGAIIYTNLGTNSGLREDQQLDVYRGEEVLKDPVTGDMLGKQRRRISRLQTTDVRDRYSKARQLGDLETRLTVGDEVEPISDANAIAVLPLVDDAGRETVAGQKLAEALIAGLVKDGVEVVERNLIADALAELTIQQSELFNPAEVQKIGKLIGARAILTGSIVPGRRQNIARLRLIEVTTAKILFASEHKVDGSLAEAKAPTPPPSSTTDAQIRRLLTSRPWKRSSNVDVYTFVFRENGTCVGTGEKGGDSDWTRWEVTGETLIGRDKKGNETFWDYDPKDGKFHLRGKETVLY